MKINRTPLLEIIVEDNDRLAQAFIYYYGSLYVERKYVYVVFKFPVTHPQCFMVKFLFQADIIYHLFDRFTEYQEELISKKREEFKVKNSVGY